MVKALVLIARVLLSAEMFEIAGAAGIVAGVVLLTSWAWGLIAFGVLALLKSFDMSVTPRG